MNTKQNKKTLKAEKDKFNFSNILEKFSVKVYAEENPTETTEPEQPNNQVNFEQLIAQARKEEKEKLYPRIKKLEEENKTLTASINNYLLEIATLKREIEGLKNNSNESKEIEKLNSIIEKLKEENKNLKESIPDEQKIREKIKEEYDIKFYAQEQKTANKDKILSIFLEEIAGATKEEVDKAVAKAIEKTQAVKKDLGVENGDKKDDKKDNKEKPLKPPVAVPAFETDGTYNAEYIRNLDPRSEEYKAFRKSLGLK